MENHRQRLSQLNSRFKQQRSAASYHQPILPSAATSSTFYPINPPQAVRPQPRQQPRTKQSQTSNHLPNPVTSRPKSAHVRQAPTVQPSLSPSDEKYLTLANLTKILQMLQTQVRSNDNETSTVMSSSTTNSAKQRVQQHLQETAMRWWKPTRAADCPPPVPAPSSIPRYTNSPVPTHTPSSTIRQKQQQQQPEHVPVLTIVSNSTRQLTMTSSNDNNSSIYDESEVSPLMTSLVVPSKPVTGRLIRHEPVIMPTPGKRLHSYQHYKYSHQNPMNFSSQRLIRQT